MSKPMIKLLPIRSMLALFIICLVFSGCLSKRASRNGKDAVSEEKKEHALKLFKEGAELLFHNNQEALKKFQASYKADPTMLPAYYNAGLANEALGHNEDALKEYERCFAQDKEQAYCLYNGLIMMHALKEDEKAKALVANYLTEFPEAPFAQVAAAKLAFAQGDLPAAEKHARLAIERDAQNIEALYMMARIFFEQKRYPAARFVAKNALEIAPSHGQLHLLLGRTYEALGLMHDALDSYRLAVRFFPSEEALETLGLMLLRRGRTEEALEPLKRVRELRPEQYRHSLHLGNAFMANKLFPEAKAAYDRALALNPEDKDINYNLGLLFYDFKPNDMTEIERLKRSQAYFKSYLEQPNLAKERTAEVNDYIKKLGNKIEAEELAAQPAPEEPEAPVEETPPAAEGE